MKRVYISGAITGTTDYMERFAAAEEKLTAEGYSVINPAKLGCIMPEDADWIEYMEVCFCLLGFCDSIYMLKGWTDSRGANAERSTALIRGMNIIMEE